MLHRIDGNKEMYLRIRALAREMRRNSTYAEDYFWEKVRNRRLFGLKINRQFIIQCPVSNNFIKYYIADFHCALLKLIIEIDGAIHHLRESEDLIRTAQMMEQGYTVIRFSNEQVLNHWEDVELVIKKFMEE